MIRASRFRSLDWAVVGAEMPMAASVPLPAMPSAVSPFFL
jgi:hypothetical protein